VVPLKKKKSLSIVLKEENEFASVEVSNRIFKMKLDKV
jgi:hypothetical protein